jgi:hypothetical protein
LAVLLLARDDRRRRRELLRLLPRPDVVKIHRPAGASEAPGDGVVLPRRLVRRVECPEADPPERISASKRPLGRARTPW